MKIAQVTGQAALNAITALLNNGTMVVYSGTQPTNPDTALSGNTALVTGTLSATAFGTATISGGYAQANASFTSTTPTISVSGTASFARWYETGGSVAVMDWTVGTSGTDITVPTTTFTNGVRHTNLYDYCGVRNGFKPVVSFAGRPYHIRHSSRSAAGHYAFRNHLSNRNHRTHQQQSGSSMLRFAACSSSLGQGVDFCLPRIQYASSLVLNMRGSRFT